jgi:hypothetical protein
MRNRLSNSIFLTLCTIIFLVPANCFAQEVDGFTSMFNGENLLGWHVSGDNPKSIYIEDKAIVTHGERAHVFYVGETGHADFKNFHFKAKVKTLKGANSGIYFHTKFQANGWPSIGYEAQVNNTQSDPKKTGGLYAIQDNFEAPVKDDEWFDYEIIVKGKQIVIKINDKTISDYTEPENAERKDGMKDRILSSGTFALQAHDPGSKVYFKDLMVKPLDD